MRNNDVQQLQIIEIVNNFKFYNCLFINMERTSIIAQSNKLIFNAHLNNKCPNCTQYQSQIQSLRRQLNQKFKLIEVSMPSLVEVLQKQQTSNYEQELLKLRHSYDLLKKKLLQLDSQNEQMIEENHKIVKQNKKLKTQIQNYEKESLNINKEKRMDQIFPRHKNQETLDDKSILSQISTNIMNKSLLTVKSYHGTNYLQQLLERRQKIQNKRHFSIEKLSQLLSEF